MGPDGEQSSHVASTVEMTSTIVPCKIFSFNRVYTWTGQTLENWECIFQPEKSQGILNRFEKSGNDQTKY